MYYLLSPLVTTKVTVMAQAIGVLTIRGISLKIVLHC